MQPKENYQQVLVSKTLFKRLVNLGALCSGCLMPADIHGGHVPCQGAHIILDTEIINAITTKTSELNGRPLRRCEHGHIIGGNRTCTQCEASV